MKYLLATDGSEQSNKAIDHISEILRNDKDTIFLSTIYMVEPEEMGVIDLGAIIVPEGDSSERIAEQRRILEEKAKNLLSEAKKRLMDKGVDESIITLLAIESSDPRSAILEAQKENDISTIVMGSRGRGTLTGLLLGSTSSYIATHADSCSVLIVH